MEINQLVNKYIFLCNINLKLFIIFFKGHTKSYSKVLLPYEEELMGKCIKIKITKSFRWHMEGEIIDRNPPLVQVPPDYFKNYKEQGYTKREEKYQ